VKYQVIVSVMPHQALLDPQGKAVGQRLQQQLGAGIGEVRMGKLIQMDIEAETEAAAQKIAENAIQSLLANPVMERGTILSTRVFIP
jgi:phosphoribosylformylglycinamidine synthase PurS subunit